jgi:hypothetical protein
VQTVAWPVCRHTAHSHTSCLPACTLPARMHPSCPHAARPARWPAFGPSHEHKRLFKLLLLAAHLVAPLAWSQAELAMMEDDLHHRDVE